MGPATDHQVEGGWLRRVPEIDAEGGAEALARTHVEQARELVDAHASSCQPLSAHLDFAGILGPLVVEGELQAQHVGGVNVWMPGKPIVDLQAVSKVKLLILI